MKYSFLIIICIYVVFLDWVTTGNQKGIELNACDSPVQSKVKKWSLLDDTRKGFVDFFSVIRLDFLKQCKDREGIKVNGGIAFHNPAFPQNQGVLGTDFTRNGLTEIFQNRSKNKLLMTDGTRTIIAEESETTGEMNAPWHSHNYIQNNNFKSFKKENINFFKSNGKEPAKWPLNFC